MIYPTNLKACSDSLGSKFLRWGFSIFFPLLFCENQKMVKFANMPNFRDFPEFEISEIDLEALFFKGFKIPTVKIWIFR